MKQTDLNTIALKVGVQRKEATEMPRMLRPAGLGPQGGRAGALGSTYINKCESYIKLPCAVHQRPQRVPAAETSLLWA